MGLLVQVRNMVIGSLYRHILKPIFFRFDPENVHDKFIQAGAQFGKYWFTRYLGQLFFSYQNKSLVQKIAGLHFANPVGLGAGFDKNGEIVSFLPAVGFGFAEIGSVTGEVCAGNVRPRLWRLPRARSLIVNYGLKNDGAKVVADRLSKLKSIIPLGGNVAMTNCQDNLDLEKGITDFAAAFQIMEPVVDYITVNISCPNTTGGQPFLEPENLDQLLTILDRIPTRKPVFLKLSPDLDEQQVDTLLVVVKKHRVQGLVCSNLTKQREGRNIPGAEVLARGGMSGQVVQDQADELLAYIYKKEGRRFILVGCGGIFSAEDVYQKIRAGASLVQLVTGLIYEGPQVVAEINQGLGRLLQRDGYKNISEAVGVNTR